MAVPCNGSETFCSDMGCVHSAHTPFVKTSHTASTDVICVGEYFSQRQGNPGGVPVSTIYFKQPIQSVTQ